jgi:hypothetical protein
MPVTPKQAYLTLTISTLKENEEITFQVFTPTSEEGAERTKNRLRALRQNPAISTIQISGDRRLTDRGGDGE